VMLAFRIVNLVGAARGPLARGLAVVAVGQRRRPDPGPQKLHDRRRSRILHHVSAGGMGVSERKYSKMTR
jgi:hypothetical protein